MHDLNYDLIVLRSKLAAIVKDTPITIQPKHDSYPIEYWDGLSIAHRPLMSVRWQTRSGNHEYVLSPKVETFKALFHKVGRLDYLHEFAEISKKIRETLQQ